LAGLRRLRQREYVAQVLALERGEQAVLQPANAVVNTSTTRSRGPAAAQLLTKFMQIESLLALAFAPIAACGRRDGRGRGGGRSPLRVKLSLGGKRERLAGLSELQSRRCPPNR
jgi:hypothetical protein